MPLRDRVAIVTGAGNGLGRSHALTLARLGAKVVISDIDLAGAERVATEITAAGGHAIAVAASVTDEGQVAAMVEAVMNRWSRIDILINNAGILRDKTFSKMSVADFRFVVDVHLMGAVICTQAVWDIMRRQNYGRVVMTTSSSGLYGNFGQSNYGAAKMALVGLMQTLSLEGAKNNIKVNCLAPTAATQMTAGLMPPESLARLEPSFVSPGLLALVREDAPTRVILCTGAGHFAQANITLTNGCYVGTDDLAASRVLDSWAQVTDRTGEIVPAYGFVQGEREVASATQFLGKN